MADQVDTVMTRDPRTVSADAPLGDVARTMRDADIGDGIVTDRDLVVRGIAEDKDPGSTPVSEVCTSDPTTLSPQQSVDEAVQAMRDRDVRRLPVVENGRPVGIVTIGDLAVERDTDSVLAEISAESPNN